MSSFSKMDYFFKPRSMAVIGASDDPKRIGGRPIYHSLAAGFKGAIYPVNPKYTEIFDLKCYPSLAELPVAVDLAVVAVSQKLVPAVVVDAIRSGTKALIIFSSGYAEVGEVGVKAQLELVDTLNESEIKLLGPNCLGTINTEIGLMATFSATLDSGAILAGKVGFACQSGAFGSYFLALARERGIGVKYWASTGNESQVTVADCIRYFATLDEVEVIAGYLEGIQSASELASALIAAQAANKPVILLKAGTSEIGRQAALTHTGSIVGDDAIFSALLEKYGAYRVSTIEDLIDVVDACTMGSFLKGSNLCVMTMSGGVGILMADTAAKVELDLVPPPASYHAVTSTSSTWRTRT